MTTYQFGSPYQALPLQPGTTPAPITPGGSGSLGGDPYSNLTNAGCNLISNALARAACIAAAAALRPGSNNNNTGGGGGLVATTCPPGYAPDNQGVCRTTGIGRYLPGDVGAPDVVWTPVNGRYGAGVTPIAVQMAKRVCPTGYVLGKDGVCYDHIRKGDRAHNPGTKPFLTGGEVAAIRKANRLRKKFNRLKGGRNALFPQARAAAPTKRRKSR